jgi:hypothetical protein
MILHPVLGESAFMELGEFARVWVSCQRLEIARADITNCCLVTAKTESNAEYSGNEATNPKNHRVFSKW